MGSAKKTKPKVVSVVHTMRAIEDGRMQYDVEYADNPAQRVWVNESEFKSTASKEMIRHFDKAAGTTDARKIYAVYSTRTLNGTRQYQVVYEDQPEFYVWVNDRFFSSKHNKKQIQHFTDTRPRQRGGGVHIEPIPQAEIDSLQDAAVEKADSCASLFELAE